MHKYTCPYDCVSEMIRHKEMRFLGTVGFGLEMDWSTDVETAAIKGREVKFNPEYWEGLTDEERLFLVAHEIGHRSLLHSSRAKGRNKKNWNTACDIAVNELLRHDCRGVHMPGKGWLSEDFDAPPLLSAEEYYEFLEEKDEEQQQQNEQPEDQPDNEGDGEESEMPVLGSCDLEEGGEEELDAYDVAASSDIAQANGCSSTGFCKPSRDKVAAMKTKVDWKKEILSMAKKMAREGTSWRTPRRSRLEIGYFPGPARKPKSPELFVSVDTSGSISREFFAMIVGSVGEISKIAKCDIRLVQWGTEVVYDEILKPGKCGDVQIVHGGGTEPSGMLALFSKASKESKMVCFTDGCFHCPDKFERSQDVLWVLDTNRKMPWGRTINM